MTALIKWRLAIFAMATFAGMPAAFAQLSSDALAPNPHRTLVPLSDISLLTLEGQARVYFDSLEDVTVSRASADRPESLSMTRLETRIRLRPAYYLMPRTGIRLLKLATEFEVNPYATTPGQTQLTSMDRSYEYLNETRFAINQAYFVAAHEYLIFLGGITRSKFGLGMVANPGVDAEPHRVRESPYGGRFRGDRVLRGQLAYLPFGSEQNDGKVTAPLALAVLFDRVYTDDSAIKAEGDKANQFGGGVLGRLGSMRLSTVAFKRRHEHRQGGRTDLLVALASASYAHVLDTNSRLYLEAEGALVQGHSTLSQSVLEPERVDVYAAGTIIRLGAESRKVDGVFEFGYASGDDNIFDREAHNFRFDSGYRVGAFLFSSYLRATTAASASNVTDDTFRAVPPRGYEQLATQGAIENAMYLNGRFVTRLMDSLSFDMSILHAMTAVPWADPFRSALNGGTPTGPNGSVGGTVFGQEYTFGLTASMDFAPTTCIAKFWYAHLQLGDIFDTTTGHGAGNANGFGTSLELQW